jgi:hypothetical protein
MASKMDTLRLEYRIAQVRKQTAELELRARWVGLITAAVAFTTAALSVLAGLLLILKL